MKDKLIHVITLYKRNLNGTLQQWSIEYDEDIIVIRYGKRDGKLIEKIIDNLGTQSNYKKVLKLIKDKKNKGYREDPFDKTMGTDISGNVKPALANKNLDKAEYPCFEQPKYNGLKSLMSLEQVEIEEGMFTSTELQVVFRSKEGHVYHLPHLSEWILNNFRPNFFNEEGENMVFDGELYIHGKKLNYIRASVPTINDKGTISKPKNSSLALTYVIYDIASKKMNQHQRLSKLKVMMSTVNRIGSTIQELQSGTFPVCISEHKLVKDRREAMNLAKEYLLEGFEGAMLRKIDSPYMFGKRTNDLIKIKFGKTGTFVITDVIPKPSEPETGIFVLRNDINNETFKSNPMGDYYLRKSYLDFRDKLIGQVAEIKYEERGGVKDVPMHSNVIKVI